ncbi:MAG: FAD-binding oxidoreductase [Spirochaetes bacterium]|nr:FAD-binding oxidoreductase [Spirochaetota bacterium]
MRDDLIKPFSNRFAEYLDDESKMHGWAESISFPVNPEEVCFVVKKMADAQTSITIQGGKTGICGGAVPAGGHILNLSYLNKIIGMEKRSNQYCITVEAGVLLSDLENQIYKKSFDTSQWDEDSLNILHDFKRDQAFFWPPSPTEKSATIGGILSNNALGCDSCFYGETKQYVESITVVDNKGEVQIIERGNYVVKNQICPLPDGRSIKVKSSFFLDGMDLIDIYLGSEGRYGVIVKATLRLIEKPAEIWGIGFFFEQQNQLAGFVNALKILVRENFDAHIVVLEYLDQKSLHYIYLLKQVATKLQELPDVDDKFVGMVYLELHGTTEEAIESIAERLMELGLQFDCQEEATWALSGEEEIEKIHHFRHGAPESINIVLEEVRKNNPEILKLSTDFSLSDLDFLQLVKMYQQDAEQAEVEIAIFGHIMDNHFHVNIIPRTKQQYINGIKLIEKWTEYANNQKGKIFLEHGIGKLKKKLFAKLADPTLQQDLIEIKKVIDPGNTLNPFNVLDLK